MCTVKRLGQMTFLQMDLCSFRGVASRSCRNGPVVAFHLRMVAELVSIEAAQRTSRDQMVLDHLSLVRAIALRVHESLPVHVDLDDLVHWGVMGLFGAGT